MARPGAPVFVRTSEGYLINLTLVRWIRIEDNRVRFNFVDGADWVDVPLEEGLSFIGQMDFMMLA